MDLNIFLRLTPPKVLLLSSAALLGLTVSAFAKGGWRSLVDKSEAEAQALATVRQEKYAALTQGDSETIGRFARENCPELNADMIEKGLSLYFEEKVEKWQRRSTLSGRNAIEEVNQKMRVKSQYNLGPDSLEAWQQTLSAASARYPVLHFQYVAFQGLGEVIKKAREMLYPEQELENDQLINLSYVLNRTAHVKGSMKIGNEVTRFKNLHKHLSNKLRELMGFEEDAFQKEFVKESIVKVIDVEYRKKNILPKEMVGDLGFRPAVAQWTKNKPINKDSHDWGHGDMMISLVKGFATKTIIHSYFYPSVTGEYDPFEFLSEKLNSEDPFIISCSFIPYTPKLFLQRGEKGVMLSKNTAFAVSEPKFYEDIENDLKTKFPEIKLEEPLSEEHLRYLKSKEYEKTKNAPGFVNDICKRQDNSPKPMILACCNNDAGPLRKGAFHNATLDLLSEGDSEEHALVALNFNFVMGNLEESSHSAGDYKHMAVVVPGHYISVVENDEELPYILEGGGHSSATAILSAVVSHVRGLFPHLTHLQVREAVLSGANRDFEGYDEEVHGQGMINLKGALDVANNFQPLVIDQLNENNQPVNPP